MKIEVGDLLFVRPHSFIGNVVSKIMDSEFSHVCMAVSEFNVFESQLGHDTRITEIYFDDFEVVKMNINDVQRKELLKYINESNILDSEYDLFQTIGWFLQQAIKRIDKNDKFNIVSHFDNPNNLICIEAILKCYHEGLGIRLSNKNNSLVDFNDLYKNDYRLH